MTIYSWPPPPPTSAASGGNSGGLETSGEPVDVSAADPPVAGQVLTAVDPTHAQWRVPGLHYDPAIRFNVDALGTATIEPGTWGFVQTIPVGSETTPIVFVVSSLTAPPVDSRFGLYISPDLPLPSVEVHLVGASQIMGLDGTLGTTCTLYPGAIYEWIFYHEGGAAIWGMVSDTARIAQRFDAPWNVPSDMAHAVFQIAGSAEPADGSSIVYRNVGGLPTAKWEAIVPHATTHERGGSDILAAARISESSGPTSLNIGAVSDGQVLKRVGTTVVGGDVVDDTTIKTPVRVVTFSNIALTGLQTINGVTLAANDRVLINKNTTGSQNGVWLAQSGAWIRAPDFATGAQVKSGVLITAIEDGSGNKAVWMLTTSNPIVIGTTALSFVPVAVPRALNGPTTTGDISTPVQVGVSYKWATEDHAHNYASQHYGFNGLRLSTSSVSSVPTDGTFSTIYLTPHTSNRISLATDGVTYFPIILASGISIAVTGQSAGIPCDVFVVYGSFSFATLELVPWSNATTRATPLVLSYGVTHKSGSLNKRYVGTILPDSATTFTHRSASSGGVRTICGIWNQDNRVKSSFIWQPANATWSPSAGTTWQLFDGGSGPHIEMVLGQSIDTYSASALASVDAAGASATLGIGIDSTSAPSGFRQTVAGASGIVHAVSAQISQKSASVGRKTINMLGYGTTTAPVFQGTSGVMLSGLTLDLWA